MLIYLKIDPSTRALSSSRYLGTYTGSSVRDTIVLGLGDLTPRAIRIEWMDSSGEKDWEYLNILPSEEAMEDVAIWTIPNNIPKGRLEVQYILYGEGGEAKTGIFPLLVARSINAAEATDVKDGIEQLRGQALGAFEQPEGGGNAVFTHVDGTEAGTLIVGGGSGGGIEEAPIDGEVYGRLNGGWHKVNTRPTRVIHVDASSTDEKQDGTQEYPYHDTLDIPDGAIIFGSAVEFGPGVYSGFEATVDNVLWWTPGAHGQYRAQIQGNIDISGVRNSFSGLQVTGTVTVESTGNLEYFENVDAGAIEYNGTGYSLSTGGFVENAFSITSGAFGFFNCQFERSATYNLIMTGGQVYAADTTNINLIRNDGAGPFIGREGNTYEDILDSANGDANMLVLFGGMMADIDTGAVGQIVKTGNAPYLVTGILRESLTDEMTGPRLPYGLQDADLVGTHDPVNYTATNIWLKNHFEGIDEAFGSVPQFPSDAGAYVATSSGWTNLIPYTTPGGLFVKRSGTAEIEWLSPTTFQFTGGLYVNLSTRGTISTFNLPVSGPQTWSPGTFALFNRDTEAWRLLEAALMGPNAVGDSESVVAFMGYDSNNRPEINVFGGHSYVYEEVTDHTLRGSLENGNILTFPVTDAISLEIRGLSEGLGYLRFIGTTTINNVDICMMRPNGANAVTSRFLSGTTITTTGPDIDTAVPFDGTMGTIWIIFDSNWYEVQYTVFGSNGERVFFNAHKKS